MLRTVLHARWIVPVESPPIHNGRIVVDDGLITALEPKSRTKSADIDLGDAVVLPGFVNAHTHLELTACRGLVPYRGSFTDWIETLTSLNPIKGGDQALRHQIRDGLQQSSSAGVIAIGDIGYGLRSIEEWSGASVHTVGFLETLGMGPKRLDVYERSIDRVIALCEQADSPLGMAARAGSTGPLQNRLAGACGSLHVVGISPHAPYSTDASVYRRAIEFAERTHRPICTHWAETRDELQFLADGTGPFRELLERLGLWDGSFSPPGCSPIEYARRLGLLACGALLVHVNYVTDADIALLAGSGCSVVYCPRSHMFFEHEQHRYRDMLAGGINVCIGTDSLASNESLSILDELRFMRACDQTVSGQELIEMGTLAGARGLRLEKEIGSLVPGKRADLVVVPLEDPRTRDPIDDLLSGNSIPSPATGVELP